MKIGVFGEYLGDVATEALLQNITNENPVVSSIGWLRESVPGGFSVTAEFERPYAENDADNQKLQDDLITRFKSDDPRTWQPKPAKVVRIVLEAKRRT
jgi:hypothetical protein